MSIRSGSDLKGQVTLRADAIVVGTGAGGSIAARELARAGAKVIAVEEGAHTTSADFNQREEQMLPLLFQDRGGRTTDDLAIRVLQGRGLGGSTVHNTNLCKRTPDAILELWHARHHVTGMRPHELAPAFERIEADLSVSEIPQAMRNRNNDILRIGAEALGWRGGQLKHNRVGCQGSGFCELGCVYNAKQNALKIVIPQAVEAGADVLADVRAVKILHDGQRVTGLTGEALDREGRVVGEVAITAPVVVLSASAVGSAALARASHVPDPHGLIGKRLRMHPGGVVAGRFKDPVSGDKGIPQSYECTEHLSFEEGSDKRVWITTAFAHPIGTASVLPGFGAKHMSMMRSYRHFSVLTAMLHDESTGEVYLGSDGRPAIRYEMNRSDCLQLQKGLRACAELLFAAGAEEVVIPATPQVIVKSRRDLDRIDWSFGRPHGVPLTAVHPMGTMPLGDDPRSSVVNCQGEHHALRGLFVADGSLFPTSIGGPPQISIYSFAQHLAPHMIARARSPK